LLSRQHLQASTIATTHLETERHRFRWNHHTSFFPFQLTATSICRCHRRKQPRKGAVLTVFQQTSTRSFSLNSSPNLSSKAPGARQTRRRDLQEVQLARTRSSRRAQESTTEPSPSFRAPS
ncbi:Leucine-rich repeat protein kinase family protein, partial [Prunus dulcis]